MNCPICSINKLMDDQVECLDCQMSGRGMEFYLSSPVREELLKKIRDLSVVKSANLWPTGPCAWVIGITYEDKTLVAGAGGQDEGVVAWAPVIPPVGMTWVLVEHENPGGVIGVFTDEEVVDAVGSA